LEGDFAGLPGHLSVLSSLDVETAVLESARGGAVSIGLGFDQCDVAVCLAVTEDHLGDSGINTLAEMAELKLSIVQRASKAVVLNADNPHSASMQHQLPGRKLCLVSTQRSLEQLRTDYPKVSCFALLAQRNGEPWICLYDGDAVAAVIAVAAIPATCGGAARHYVSNAMHAIAACYLGDVPIAAIRDALSSFVLTYETTPGRLNIHRGGGVTVVMDFAQNPDSLRELICFTESMHVRGRRILGLSCSAENSDALIRDTAMVAAGQFDHYVCKNFKASDKRAAYEVPRLLSEGLQAGGVQSAAITIIEDAMAAVEALVAMARDGDLLVVMTGRIYRAQTWAYVTEHLR